MTEAIEHGPISIGFTLLGNGNWRGGLNYQKTLLELIAGPLSESMTATVFVAPTEEAFAKEHFGGIKGVSIVVDERAADAGRGLRALKALLFGSDLQFEALVDEYDINVVFENARFYGWFFSKPVISWIPDFQHRWLPQLFSAIARIKRDIGFRAQCRGRRIILLSSNSAQKDCESFYARSKGRTMVARFCSDIDIAAVKKRTQTVCETYRLPSKVFYLPNHFWAHKNHEIVLEALILLKQSGQLESLPPIVMSGPTTDGRDLELFNRYMQKVEDNGLSNWLHHIGLIPYQDVLALNCAAIAVLNPSYFEGWSSSVEEAKSLQSHLIISDIPVHREQAPDADFFPTDDPKCLASLMLSHAKSGGKEALANPNNDFKESRKAEFAEAFYSCVVFTSKL